MSDYERSKIVATAVPGHLRATVLPQRFSGLFLIYETLVYRYMDKFCKDYQGGYWEFIDLNNGGFYMSLKIPKCLSLIIEGNQFSGTVTADAASVIVNLFVLCELANEYKLDHLTEMYHALRDYACEHSEANKILQAID